MVENETSLMLTCPLYIIYQEKFSLTKFVQSKPPGFILMILKNYIPKLLYIINYRKQNTVYIKNTLISVNMIETTFIQLHTNGYAF